MDLASFCDYSGRSSGCYCLHYVVVYTDNRSWGQGYHGVILLRNVADELDYYNWYEYALG